jgi:hypothetical protein
MLVDVGHGTSAPSILPVIGHAGHTTPVGDEHPRSLAPADPLRDSAAGVSDGDDAPFGEELCRGPGRLREVGAGR